MWAPIIIAISLHCQAQVIKERACKKEVRQCILDKLQKTPQGTKDDFLLECLVELDR